MSNAVPATPSPGDITLRFIELCQFRRLGKVQLDVDKKTTILVGANNCSGQPIPDTTLSFSSATAGANP